MAKELLLIISVLVVAHSLYTRSEFERVNMRNRLQEPVPSLSVSTICNKIDLDVYNYTGVVRSGYLTVGKGNSALAFTFYGNSQEKDAAQLSKYPTIIWLNGGPGSTSQYGNLNEIGPLLVTRDAIGSKLKVTRNEFSWANKYNLLFVDQPVGTGLSYADPQVKDVYAKSTQEVAKDFYNALDQLYNSEYGCFNSKNLNIPASSALFLMGESYAGKYIPSIAAEILSRKQGGGFLTGLKGIGYGNGFTSPMEILSQIGTFAFSLGLIDYQQRIVVQKYLINATLCHESSDYHSLHEIFDKTINYIVKQAGHINVYDIRAFGDYEDTPAEYFHQSEIVDLFAFNPQIRFGMQADQVYMALYQDFMKSEARTVQRLLEKGLPIIIYNGQQDLKVTNGGAMSWVDNLYFKEKDEFRSGLLQNWKVNGKVAGSMKKAGNLEFRIVYNAGHLAPMDQPENTLEMISSFVEQYKQGTPEVILE